MNRKNVLTTAVLMSLVMSPAFAQEVAESDPQAPVADSADAQDLDAVLVEGVFLNTAAKSATKMDIAVMDTPFSVQSYSSAFIESIEAQTLGDLLGYMTGVKKAGLTGMDITFRGFKSSGDDQNALLVDGLPGLAGRFGSPPSIGIESVELVRGSMSVLYGQNQPGGFINMVTKKPQYDRTSSVGIRGTAYAGAGLSLGDATGYQVDFDTTGHVDEGGKLLYRIVGQHGDRDTFRDLGFEKGTYLAPSLTWNIGGSTYLTGQVEYRKSRTSFDQGLVAPDRDMSRVASVTTFYGEPGTFREEDGTTLSLFLSHTFANDWQWNTSVRSVDYDSEQKEFSHVGVRNDDRTLNRRARHLETARSYDNFDTNLTMAFDTGSSISHKMIVGVSGGRDQARETRLKFFNSVCPGVNCFDIDIYNPVYGQAPDFDSIPSNNPATPHLLTNNGFESRNLAFYASDLISFGEKWKLSLGVRNFSEKQELSNLKDPSEPSVRKDSRESLLPMGGLLYQPNENWTVYASYSESYVPADPDDQDVNGENHFQPLSGEQTEIGVKTENLFDGRLNASLALFRIDQSNVMNSFSCPLGVCYDQLGKARSEGVEFEANLRPMDHWQLTLGYAYTDARVVASNVAVQVNTPLANSPRHQANIWSSYTFENGIGLGIGATYIGDYQGVVPAANNPTLMPMPGYTLVDAALSYGIGDHSWNLKLGNLFDEEHYEGTGLTGQIQIVPGAPRNLTLSYRFKF